MSELPPGPNAPPLVQTAHWLFAPVDFMESCERRYGDAFSVRFAGFRRPMVMLSSPVAIAALYTQPEQLLPPGRVLSLRPIMGPQSVLLLEGEAHLQRRRLMLPPFHGERMRAYEEAMREIAAAQIERWPRGRDLVVAPLMAAITLEVILRVVFGVSDARRLAGLRELLPALLAGTSSTALSVRVLLARRSGGPDPLAAFQALRAQIDTLLAAEIAQRRDEHGDRGDVLSLLLSARLPDGSPIDDGELLDQLVTLLLAGHETTATALAWTFDLLTHNPAARERLTAEIRRGDGEERYLRAVVSESLRLRPVVPLAGRRLASELRVDGLTLPAGTDVTPAIWLTHMREDLYRRPREFRPERFLESPPSTYAWIPFGGGVRRCLGAAFAELEMRVVIGCVLRALDVAAVHAAPERVQRRNVTFSPRHGTRMRVLTA